MTGVGCSSVRGADGRRSPPTACTIMVPVWGRACVRRFLDVSLPSLLAPGNIPAVARLLPTEVVLLTRSRDMPSIESHPVWRRLAAIGRVALREIDDLVAEGNHHATVTLAYDRALRDKGAALRDTLFLCLVADYLVADGSLRALVGRILRGASAVLTGTLPLRGSAIAPLLRELPPATDDALVLPSRLLVRWALAHPSQERVVSAGDGHVLADPEANRLFWSVDAQTLIARFYLLHVAALHPEVDDFVTGAPCDYGFVPELCPSGPAEMVTDSDEYLAVEMQDRDIDVGRLRWGDLSPARLASSLERWTTLAHRRNATTSLVFHAGAIPGSIAETEVAASRFVAEVASALRSPPQPHRGHPAWAGMMALQHARAADAGDGRSPSGGWPARSWRLRLRVLGDVPAVTAWHPRWPDYRALRDLLRAQLRPADRMVIVGGAAHQHARWLGGLCAGIACAEADAPAMPAPDERFDACLLLLGAPDDTLAGVARLVAPGGLLVVAAVDEDLDLRDRGLRRRCLSLLERLPGCGLRIEQVRCVAGGPLRGVAARWMSRAVRAGRGRSGARLILAWVGCAVAAIAVRTCNAVTSQAARGRAPAGDATAVLIACRRVAEAGPIDGREHGRYDSEPRRAHPVRDHAVDAVGNRPDAARGPLHRSALPAGADRRQHETEVAWTTS